MNTPMTNTILLGQVWRSRTDTDRCITIADHDGPGYYVVRNRDDDSTRSMHAQDILEHYVPDGGELLTPAEVARIFRVDTRTVTRWADAGRLRAVRTPGGHRRYSRRDVEAALRAGEAGGE